MKLLEDTIEALTKIQSDAKKAEHDFEKHKNETAKELCSLIKEKVEANDSLKNEKLSYLFKFLPTSTEKISFEGCISFKKEPIEKYCVRLVVTEDEGVNVLKYSYYDTKDADSKKRNIVLDRIVTLIWDNEDELSNVLTSSSIYNTYLEYLKTCQEVDNTERKIRIGNKPDMISLLRDSECLAEETVTRISAGVTDSGDEMVTEEHTYRNVFVIEEVNSAWIGGYYLNKPQEKRRLNTDDIIEKINSKELIVSHDMCIEEPVFDTDEEEVE